jgi:hypothetical protein
MTSGVSYKRRYTDIRQADSLTVEVRRWRGWGRTSRSCGAAGHTYRVGIFPALAYARAQMNLEIDG